MAASQLLIYHFMFGPTYTAGCPINSSIADSIDGLDPPPAGARRDDAPRVASATRAAPRLSPSHRLERTRGRHRAIATSTPTSGYANNGGGDTSLGLHGNLASLPPIVERNAKASRHRCRRVSHPEPGLQRVRARRRCGLPDLCDRLARARVPDGLLPDPRPDARRAGTRTTGSSSGSAATTSTPRGDGRGRRQACGASSGGGGPPFRAGTCCARCRSARQAAASWSRTAGGSAQRSSLARRARTPRSCPT